MSCERSSKERSWATGGEGTGASLTLSKLGFEFERLTFYILKPKLLQTNYYDVNGTINQSGLDAITYTHRQARENR